MTLKEIIQKAMKENQIYSIGEAQNAVEFVEQVLEGLIEMTREEYPEATRTIDEMVVAKSRVTDIYHDLYDIED
jgi:hypothetical protein